MKFIRYKNQIPLNLEQVEAFELVNEDSKYLQRINFYSPKFTYKWDFKNKEEAVKIYEKLLNMFVTNVGETIDFGEKPVNVTIVGGTAV